MSEPRYQTRVGDPDETTRIPKEALDALRDADQAQEANGPGPSGHSTGTQPATPGRSGDGRPSGNGSTPAPRNVSPGGGPGPGNGPANGSALGPGSGATPSATPSVAPEGRPGGFRPAANGTGGSIGPAGGPGGGPSGPPAGGPPAHGGGANGSPTGYRRSETGYSPAAYPSPGSYGAGFSSLTDAPTTVTGPGTAGVGLGTAAAARSALGAATASRPSSRQSGGARPARRARLLVRHIDPWSTLKFSFVLAVAMFFVWLVAVGVLYGVLDGMGVFDQINGLYDEVSGNGGNSLFSPGLALGTAAIIGVINIVLFTALATIGAFVYNICSDLVGGIELTLAERD
jgi:hypothetical protein